MAATHHHHRHHQFLSSRKTTYCYCYPFALYLFVSNSQNNILQPDVALTVNDWMINQKILEKAKGFALWACWPAGFGVVIVRRRLRRRSVTSHNRRQR